MNRIPPVPAAARSLLYGSQQPAASTDGVIHFLQPSDVVVDLNEFGIEGLQSVACICQDVEANRCLRTVNNRGQQYSAEQWDLEKCFPAAGMGLLERLVGVLMNRGQWPSQFAFAWTGRSNRAALQYQCGSKKYIFQVGKGCLASTATLVPQFSQWPQDNSESGGNQSIQSHLRGIRWYRGASCKQIRDAENMCGAVVLFTLTWADHVAGVTNKLTIKFLGHCQHAPESVARTRVSSVALELAVHDTLTVRGGGSSSIPNLNQIKMPITTYYVNLVLQASLPTIS